MLAREARGDFIAPISGHEHDVSVNCERIPAIDFFVACFLLPVVHKRSSDAKDGRERFPSVFVVSLRSVKNLSSNSVRPCVEMRA